MEFIITLALVAALLCPLFFIYKRHQTGKNVRGALIGNIVSFFALCVLSTVFVMGSQVLAADSTAVATTAADGLKYIGAALAVGLACIGGGIAVSAAASAALGALSENDGIFGKALIFVGLAEGVALYGLLVALLILFM
jgi:V/A-type H+-transporting ATPase subunit K